MTEEQPDLVPGFKPLPQRTGTKRDGYAARPGSGPSGESCKTCKHAARFRKWAKCALMKHAWTGGFKTDILLNTPACSKWEKEMELALA